MPPGRASWIFPEPGRRVWWCTCLRKGPDTSGHGVWNVDLTKSSLKRLLVNHVWLGSTEKAKGHCTVCQFWKVMENP